MEIISDIILRHVGGKSTIFWGMTLGVIVTLILLTLILNIMLTDKFKAKYRLQKKLGLIFMIVFLYISSIVFIGYKYKENKKEILDSYKLEKTEEYFINDNKYNEIVKSIYDEKREVTDVFKNKENSKIEKLLLDIPAKLKDSSKSGSNEKTIKVMRYRSSIDKSYLFISYPKEIKVIEEIR